MPVSMTLVGAYVDEILRSKIMYCARNQCSGNVSEQIRRWIHEGIRRDVPEIKKKLQEEQI